MNMHLLHNLCLVSMGLLFKCVLSCILWLSYIIWCFQLTPSNGGTQQGEMGKACMQYFETHSMLQVTFGLVTFVSVDL